MLTDANGILTKEMIVARIKLLEPLSQTELRLSPILSKQELILWVEALNEYGRHITTLNLCGGNLEGAAYATELAKLKHVTALNFRQNGVNTAGAIALLQNPSFKKLDLSNSDFYNDAPGDVNQEALLQAVRANNTLVEFKVARSGLPAAMVQQIEAHFEKKKLPSSSNGARFEFAEKHPNCGASVSEIAPSPSSPTNGHK